MKRITILIVILSLSNILYGTPETYSVRKSSIDLIENMSFEVIDGRFYDIPDDLFHDKSTQFILKLGVEERSDFGYFNSEATIDFEVRVDVLDGFGIVTSTTTEHLVIDYDPAGGLSVDMNILKLNGGHRYRVTIEEITLSDVASLPAYVYLEGELTIDRFYDLDITTVPVMGMNLLSYDLSNNEYIEYDVPSGSETETYDLGGFPPQEVELFWDYIEGAEEYELEWTWIDNYSATSLGDALAAGDVIFRERDFELNNTRIITSAQNYRIPLIYSKGFLIYRVRAVGRWTDNDLLDTDKLKFGKWSTASSSLVTVATYPNYLIISADHDGLKNWQYQAVYAEQGKKKEIISYFDGSLRNRQTVTRINSNKEAIVGENVYDNQGRSAIQILPTPVGNSALRYYEDLNQNSDGIPYTHDDFDWDTGECLASPEPMLETSGAAQYYSDDITATNDWQDFVPQAGGFPFVQVQYTPDNTGRIRSQSGVGPDYLLDGPHATKYFYIQPFQEELNRMFGYQAGYNQHYKKNLVVDANGQVSISYIDPQGRVIATALAGNNNGEAEGEYRTNLESLASHDEEGVHGEVEIDLLNKNASTDPDTELDNNQRFVTGVLGPYADALLVGTQYPSVDEQNHVFDYSVTTGTFSTECMPEGVAYPFAYDLTIDLKDDCGLTMFPTAIETLVSGTSTTDYTSSEGTIFSLTDTELTALLKTGAYTLTKRIQVNQDTLEKHLEHYLANLSEECLLDFYQDNVDCNDTLPDSLIITDFDLNACFIGEQTMLMDLMPGGQYGSTDLTNPTSIFNLENVLAQGEYDAGSPSSWKIPFSEYQNSDGTPSKILVHFDGDATYSPAVNADGLTYLTGEYGAYEEGDYFILPEHLEYSADFLAEFKASWAKSLLGYHPEFQYLAYFEDLCNLTYASTEIEIDGVLSPISSETYDKALLFVASYEEATTALDNVFGYDLLDDVDLDNNVIRNIDPYFNLEYDVIGGEDENTFKMLLMDEILSNYKDTDLSLWETVVKTVICGTDFTEGCTFDATLTGYATETKDLIWNMYKMMYLSEKSKVNQIFLDVYAIENNFYNGYIGEETPSMPNLTGFLYYPDYLTAGITIDVTDYSITEFYADAIIAAEEDGEFPWFVKPDVAEFASKVKRFQPVHALYDAGLPEGDMVADMTEEIDAAIFLSTGKCALLYDTEMLLSSLAAYNVLAGGSSINADGFSGLTPDLYTELGGENGTDDVIISSTLVGTQLQIEVTNANGGTVLTNSVRIDNPSPGDIAWTWNWANVTGFEMLYYEPLSVVAGVYPFQILAIVDVAGATKEVVLIGETEVSIGDCSFGSDINCEKDEHFANDLRAIFAELYLPGTSTLDAVTIDAADLGGWYAGSETAHQLGDNPFAPLATLSSTTLDFTLENTGLDREINVSFGIAAIPSDIETVTGAQFNEGTGVLTLYYIDDAGDAGTFVGTVVNEDNSTATTVDFLDLSCMCGNESELATALEFMFNDLLAGVSFGPLADPLSFDLLSILYGPDSDFGVVSYIESSTKIGVIFGDGPLTEQYQCEIEFKEPNDGSLTNLQSVFGLTVFADEDGTFTASGYGILTDGSVIELKMTSIAHVLNCFQEITCHECVPVTLAPQSCDVQWAAYQSFINVLNADLISAGADSSELFPIYADTSFCETRLAYSVQAYLQYIGIDGFNITSPDDDHFISLDEFANTNLNAFYPDVDEDDFVDVIDDYFAYENATDPANAHLSWGNYVNLIYLQETVDICPPNPLPYYPDFTFEYPCEMYTANVDSMNAITQKEIYLAKLAENFKIEYIEQAISSLVETFEVTYLDKEFHYTLYYYDQAGNLVQTVPPKGVDRFETTLDEVKIKTVKADPTYLTAHPEDTISVRPNHTYRTQYHYNSLNQLIWQSTPDGGESRFGYDDLGRLVVSQNAKQAAATNPQFSYTKYDDLGRITEVGEMTLDASGYYFDENGRFRNPLDELVAVSSASFPTDIADYYAREEVTRTQYDELVGIPSSEFIDYAADNTRNRITGVYYHEVFTLGTEEFNNATFYDYDVHGNVKEIIQLNNDDDLQDMEQDLKKVEYEYDLVSGNVKHVTYQADELDQFIHEYEYDADNRITNVRTSKDDIIWEQDAKYFYYDHGPLARTEIGDKKVVANDYAYTIQGWLKGVNSEELVAADDQGKDSYAGINSMNGKDVFGYSLHYYEGDYTARHGNDFLSLSGSALPHTHNRNLYNGNIKEMYTASTNTAEEYIGTSHTWYNYDQLNRIKSMDQERIYDGTTESRYASTYSFDANGNLETLTRHAWDGTAKVDIDDFTYHYNDTDADPSVHNNQLYYVEDSKYNLIDGPGSSVLGDGSDLASQMAFEGADADYDGLHNYHYDEIGQLIEDRQEEIAEIQWKVTGKVHKIIREPGSTKSNLEFVYDAMGNRIMKIVSDNSGNVLEKYYYIRDAQGNVMSLYTYIPETGEDDAQLFLTERDIYGSSRLGVEQVNQVIASFPDPGYITINEENGIYNGIFNHYAQTVGDKRYELSNHLGNVLEVLTDRKLQIETAIGSGVLDYYSADVVSQSDYFPFGMLLPNTNIDPTTGESIEETNDYRYAFNGMEKDDEVKGEGNSYTTMFRQYDSRVGRWLSVDPVTRYDINPYNAFSNSPIVMVDPNGDTDYYNSKGKWLGTDGVDDGVKLLVLMKEDIKSVRKATRRNNSITLNISTNRNLVQIVDNSLITRMDEMFESTSDAGIEQGTVVGRKTDGTTIMENSVGSEAEINQNGARKLILEQKGVIQFDIHTHPKEEAEPTLDQSGVWNYAYNDFSSPTDRSNRISYKTDYGGYESPSIVLAFSWIPITTTEFRDPEGKVVSYSPSASYGEGYSFYEVITGYTSVQTIIFFDSQGDRLKMNYSSYKALSSTVYSEQSAREQRKKERINTKQKKK